MAGVGDKGNRSTLLAAHLVKATALLSSPQHAIILRLHPLHLAFPSYHHLFSSYKPLFHTLIRDPTPPLPTRPQARHHQHPGDVDDTRNINLTPSQDRRPSLLASSFPACISQHTLLRDTLWLLLASGQHQPNNRLATSKPRVCLSP